MAESRPRFQYQLQDIVLLLLLSAILPTLLFSTSANREWPQVIAVCLFSVSISSLGGLFAIRSSNRHGFSGFRRALSVFLHVAPILGLLLVAMPVTPSRTRSLMAAHETAACAACKAFAEAEELYHRREAAEYAQSLHDLYESAPGKGDVALVAKELANAEGEPGAVKTPYRGYCFKVLKAQGEKCSGGKRSYIVDGKMTKGYALVAYPFKWDTTGRDIFLISGNGTIFQKDLGEKTDEIVRTMTEFNEDNKPIPQ